jgi:hypothetical protein
VRNLPRRTPRVLAARGVTPELDVVPWAEVVARDGNLDDLPRSTGRRSCGSNRLAKTATRPPAPRRRRRAKPVRPPQDWLALDLPKGLLVRPGLIYAGFRACSKG